MRGVGEQSGDARVWRACAAAGVQTRDVRAASGEVSGEELFLLQALHRSLLITVIVAELLCSTPFLAVSCPSSFAPRPEPTLPSSLRSFRPTA